MSIFWVLCILALLQIPNAQSTLYKVGDLDSWGVPPPTKSNAYASWSESHRFKIGDSLLFLYPPSQDSVLQVTEHAYKQCDASHPISRMTDGNSLFNVTTPGNFYFVSGAEGHCEKHQRVVIQVAAADGRFFPPEAGSGSGSPAGAPSYPTVFGPMPMGLGSGSGSGAVVGVGRGGLSWAVGSVMGAGVLWGLL